MVLQASRRLKSPDRRQLSHPPAPSGALREPRGRRLASSRWESGRRVRDCLVADYEADEVFRAAALLGQLLEQLEDLPHHARRRAPVMLSRMADFVA